jgi:AraC-like DNA-binding protein
MTNLMALIGTLALGHSLFLAIFFARRKEGNRTSNWLLAFLLIALAVRVTKSVLVVLFPFAGIFAPFFGLVGMAGIGVFHLLYLKSVLTPAFVFSKKDALHLVFPGLLTGAAPFLDDGALYRAYQITVAQLFVYLAFSIVLLFKKQTDAGLNPALKRWLWLLSATIGLLWAGFFFQLLAETKATYIFVTTGCAGALYGLSFWGMTRLGVFSPNHKKRKAAPLEDNLAGIARRIRHLFEAEKVYTDPQLTLNRLAEQMQTPPYLVSKAVNAVFQKNFSELLIDSRVAEAARRLRAPENDHLSIEGIANDSGFQSLSAFYAAFKKANGVTPAEWRKQILS